MNIERFHNKRVVEVTLIVAFLLFYIIWRLMVYHDTMPAKASTDLATVYNLVSEESTYKWSIDENKCVKSDNGLEDSLYIKGWLIRQGETINTVSMHVVLRSEQTGEWYTLPTTIETRTDVTEYFENEQDYNDCGFIADIQASDVPGIDTDNFQIYVLCKINDKTDLVNLHQNLVKG